MILPGMYGKPPISSAPAITLNPTVNSTLFSYSNNNLTATRISGAGWSAVRATVSKSSGKWYWEATPGVAGGTTSATVRHQYGVAEPSNSLNYPGASPAGYGYDQVARKWNNAGNVAYGSTWVPGDVMMFALDMDNGRIFFGKNGTWQASGNPVTGANPAFTGLSGEKFPQFGVFPNTPNPSVTVNFGAVAFAFTPPTGFLALTP